MVNGNGQDAIARGAMGTTAKESPLRTAGLRIDPRSRLSTCYLAGRSGELGIAGVPG